MSLRTRLFGRPLRSVDEAAETIGPLAGIPVLGLDALASAAYGPEAALTVLLVLGAAAGRYVVPITAVILALLATVFLSYQQTIPAYPNGGGSYTVAKENLGANAGLLAASALAVDYVLNVAVAISAGVGAIVSAVPALLPHTLALCLGVLALLTFVNLRGVREAGALFLLPTYLFVGTLAVTIAIGAARVMGAGGHPAPVTAPPAPVAASGAVTLWLLLRAFASGCTALTGVEAVSNGVPLFRAPAVTNARRTLTGIVAILAALLAGIVWLARAYHVTATVPGAPGYQSVLSILVAAVAGRGVFYGVTMAAVVTVLCLSANTSFADFPRLCRLLALDAYLPAGFAHRGRRLVFNQGILALALLSAGLLVAFGGVTDRLIPLFAVGAFLAFTMSQAGMVAHWRRLRAGAARAPGTPAPSGWAWKAVMNGAGALATGATVLVVLVSKFTEGAWFTALVIPALLALLRGVRRHQERVDAALAVAGPVDFGAPAAGSLGTGGARGAPPLVVLPVRRLNRLAHRGVQLAAALSPDVEVVQVLAEDGPDTSDLRPDWEALVARPAAAAGVPAPRLVSLPSAYRERFAPIVRHVRDLALAHPSRTVAVLVVEVVERRWYDRLLNGQRALLLRELLLDRGVPNTVVVSAPWYLPGEEYTGGATIAGGGA
ncbi:amino acid permease [Gemmatimonadetes bacterium T265]|nr:amino acid permease [Gemmatimonadetes bacterium T265]